MIRGCTKIGKSRKSSYLFGPWDSLSVGLSHCYVVNQRAVKTEIAVWRPNHSWSLQFRTVGSRNPHVPEDAGHRKNEIKPPRVSKLGTASSPANLSLIRCGACQNSMRWLSS